MLVDPRRPQNGGARATVEKDLRELLGRKVAPTNLKTAYTPSYMPAGFRYEAVRDVYDHDLGYDHNFLLCGVRIIYINPVKSDSLVITEESN